MSEYQYIAFRAIDGPVSEKNLEYMQQQSSRAEITAWSFDNEYQYGDFRGNALEMLRRGYDFHLHYANYGVRKLLIRLPLGLPDRKAAEHYLDDDGLRYIPDKQGPGGILQISPAYESGTLDDLWDLSPLADRLLPLRAEIVQGDLRPLYLAHLSLGFDMNHNPEEMTEGPVPAGLRKLTKAQRALAEFCGIDEHLIAAAAKDSPPLDERHDARQRYEDWLAKVPQVDKDKWLASLLNDPQSGVRRDILVEFQKGNHEASWPTVRRNRTLAELERQARGIEEEADREAEAKEAAARRKLLAAMAADPEKTLRETEALLDKKSRSAYEEIATLLSDLREALTGTERSNLAEEHAAKLKEKRPTSTLVSELRRKGFLPRRKAKSGHIRLA